MLTSIAIPVRECYIKDVLKIGLFMLYPLSYWYEKQGKIFRAESLRDVPEEVENNYATANDIGRYLQKVGAAGMNFHTKDTPYHLFMLKILPLAIEAYGQEFPVLYRGVRTNRPDADHKVLFASPDLEVARFYGETIKTYHNVRGLLFLSSLKQVTDDEWGEGDKEVIFLP